MKTIFIDRFSTRGKAYKTVYSHQSIAALVLVKQDKKDMPNRFGLYTYTVNQNDIKRLKDNGFNAFTGTFDQYCGQ